MGSDSVERREDLKKLWAFGKNSSTGYWKQFVGRSAGQIRALSEGARGSDRVPIDGHGEDVIRADKIRLPHKEIPDCAVLQEDFSFAWIEVTIQASPDTSEMEVVAWAASVKQS